MYPSPYPARPGKGAFANQRGIEVEVVSTPLKALFRRFQGAQTPHQQLSRRRPLGRNVWAKSQTGPSMEPGSLARNGFGSRE